MLRKTVEGKRNPLTAGQEQILERFRRLHQVNEMNPMLSALMTDEHQEYLRDIWHEAGFDDDMGPYPGGEKPDRSKEIGYEEDWTSEED